MKFIERLFCDHDFEKTGFEFPNSLSQASLAGKSEFECEKCGKVIGKDRYVPKNGEIK